MGSCEPGCLSQGRQSLHGERHRHRHGAPPAHRAFAEPARARLDGKSLIYEDWNAANGIDLTAIDPETKTTTRLPFNTSANEFGGRLSPDDRWVAYVTDQSGVPEVWIAAYPSGEPRRRVDAGSHPSWNGDGSELYFISRAGNLVAMQFRGDRGRIEPGSRMDLFRVPGTADVLAGSHNIYKPSRNGQRFLVAVKTAVEVPPIRVMLNWPALLDSR